MCPSGHLWFSSIFLQLRGVKIHIPLNWQFAFLAHYSLSLFDCICLAFIFGLTYILTSGRSLIPFIFEEVWPHPALLEYRRLCPSYWWWLRKMPKQLYSSLKWNKYFIFLVQYFLYGKGYILPYIVSNKNSKSECRRNYICI